MAKRLDGRQMTVLNGVASIGGVWRSGCGWSYGTNHRTDNVLISLVSRGLADRIGEHSGFGVYRLTTDGWAETTLQPPAPAGGEQHVR